MWKSERRLKSTRKSFAFVLHTDVPMYADSSSWSYSSLRATYNNGRKVEAGIDTPQTGERMRANAIPPRKMVNARLRMLRIWLTIATYPVPLVSFVSVFVSLISVIKDSAETAYVATSKVRNPEVYEYKLSDPNIAIASKLATANSGNKIPTMHMLLGSEFFGSPTVLRIISK